MTKVEWDTSFFGFPITLFVCERLTEENIQNIEHELMLHKKALCYVVSKEKVKNGLHYDLHPMPAKISYYKVLCKSDAKYLYHPNISSLFEQNAINEQLLELAFLSGQHSRFMVDKNFSDQDFKRLYKEWLERSLTREIADEFYVYKNDKKLLGFVTLKFKKTFAEIGLIAVSQLAQGKGVGSLLINFAVSAAARKNYKRIHVSTQDNNHQACAFYEKNGFIFDEINYYSHFWTFKK